MAGNRRGGVGALVLVIALALIAFFAIVDYKSGDLNDFFNLLRDIWK